MESIKYGESNYMFKRVLVGGCILFSLLVMVGIYEWFTRPQLRIERNGASAIVHVETLGEYPTTIRHIRVKEASSGKVVFELLTEGGTPQIHDFHLSVGGNSTSAADPQYGSYRVTVPASKDTFFLQQGVKYRVTVWGDAWMSSESALKF